MAEETSESASECVERIMKHVLYTPGEIALHRGEPPSDATFVKGVVSMYGMHTGRLEESREEVVELIETLVPDGFLVNEGGGASFLDLCRDRDGKQWTSFHKIMEAFMCLAMGLDLAGYCAPYEMWELFPGGMPLVWFRTSMDVEVEKIDLDTKPQIEIVKS